MRRSLLAVALACAATAAAVSSEARAESSSSRGVLHRVKTAGETYADLADHYYGRRYLERHLRLFNHRREPLPEGTTIIVPTFRSVAVGRGQSLDAFASTYLNDRGRADYLAELHQLKGKERRFPRPGRRLKVVQSLKHRVRPGETLRSIARSYYRDGSDRRVRLLMLYNKLDNPSVRTGRSVRIPLDTEAFSHDAVAKRSNVAFVKREAVAVAAEASPPPPPPPPRAAKKKRRERPKAAAKPEAAQELAEVIKRLDESLEEAERLYEDGRYDDCEKLTGHLLAGDVEDAKTQQVEALRLRAFSLIALDRGDESKKAFTDLLALDPSYELDLYRTSPKILDVFASVAER